MRSRLLERAAAVALLLGVTACGSKGAHAGSADTDASGSAAAADSDTCVAEAAAVTSTPDGFASSFPLPRGTVVFHVEDRGADGVIATGVTDTPFADVLHAMNAAQRSGFRVTQGETEADDAEASWTGEGFTGRWAIKKSATCPGETVVQLLSKRAG